MYELIQHQRLESAASSITFSGIPQDGTDLMLVYSLRSNTTGNTEFYIKVNGINPTQRHLRGNGASVLSNTDAFQLAPATGQTASTFGNGQMIISNYTGTTQKSASIDNVTENNATTAFQSIYAANYNVTTGVTSISIDDIYGQWIAGSSATLYGINRTQAIGKPKAIGGNVTYANGYWVHTFTGSGTFSTLQDINVDALVVAGGAGGAYFAGAGGGAGGVIAGFSNKLAVGAYPVSVGSGGAGGTASNGLGSNGLDSSFLSYTAIGGGRAGTAGGSGGGGYYNQAAGAGISGQGFAGGQWNSASVRGGGGGASEAGNTDGQGYGGDGIIWMGSFYGGGGGGGGDDFATYGGIGGDGGGGNGKYIAYQQGDSATQNTGGGGGGGAFYANGGNGGSGVVIIRYPAE